MVTSTIRSAPHPPPIVADSRTEESAGCYPSSARQLAGRFGLRVLELFEYTDGEGHLTVVDAGTLRERLSLTS
jgi:hypothetical protein